MRFTSAQSARTPTSPEYANVHILRWISVLVGCTCLAIAAYATWKVYTLSNRIGMNEISLEVASLSNRVSPINFGLLEEVLAIDKEKKSFMLPSVGWDMFYATSTATTILTSTPSSSPTPSSTSTPL